MTSSSSPPKGRFGTFVGVFTPNVLTILGLVLFLRTGWLVGQRGLAGALVIIAVANLISLLTGLSLSAIATNMRVRTGGAYYIIHRTLGPEVGGAIGIPLFLSQAMSVGFYVIGFVAAVNEVFPAVGTTGLAVGVVLIFGLLAYLGADFVLRIQFVVLGALGLALISFFAGGWGAAIEPSWGAPAEATVGPFTAFAVFFPAVTGIVVGASMSGDLRNPGKNIPRGTLLSIGVTLVIYVATAVWLALHVGPAELVADETAMQHMARWPWLVFVGVVAATLSSALGSILAAPRTLEAIARDRVLPRFLAARLGSRTEPRLAVVVTTGLSVAVVSIGDLDVVAPIITMFFLNTYGMLNAAAGLERLVGNPSYRPTFRVPGLLSLLGAAGCYAAMFLINVPATLVAVVVSATIFFALERRVLKQDTGNLRSGLWYAIARFGLVRLEASSTHLKNWRLNVVAFTGVAGGRVELMDLGGFFAFGRGAVTFYHLIAGDVEAERSGRLRESSRHHLREAIDELGVAAFAECAIVDDFDQGVLNTMQSHGLAMFEPNLALLGWAADPPGQEAQLRLTARLVGLKKSVAFLRRSEEAGFGKKERIDVWWGGRDRNAELMVMLAHIISRSPAWDGVRIRVNQVVDDEAARAGSTAALERVIARARVDAEARIITRPEPGASFASLLAESSHDSDLVILGIALPRTEETVAQARAITEMVQLSGSTLLVRSAEQEDILQTSEG